MWKAIIASDAGRRPTYETSAPAELSPRAGAPSRRKLCPADADRSAGRGRRPPHAGALAPPRRMTRSRAAPRRSSAARSTPFTSATSTRPRPRRDALALDEILFLPSHVPPHRSADPRATMFHRFAMVRSPSTAAGEPRLRRRAAPRRRVLHLPDAGGAARRRLGIIAPFLHPRRRRLCRNRAVARVRPRRGGHQPRRGGPHRHVARVGSRPHAAAPASSPARPGRANLRPEPASI